MIEIPLLDLRGSDVGLRVVVTRDGNAFDGMLVDVSVSRSDYDFKDRPRVTARLEIKTAGTSLKLLQLPLDYVLQIERNTPPTDTDEKGGSHE